MLANTASPAPEDLDQDLDQGLLPLVAASLRFLSVLFRYPEPSVYLALEKTLPLIVELAVDLLDRPLALPPRHELEASYTALFLAAPQGVPAPLYLSCHLEGDGLVGGEVAGAMRRILAAEGLKLEACGNEPLDHLALVLELSALLAERLNGEPGPAGGRRLESLRHLLFDCLEPALGRLAPVLARVAPESLYADGARLSLFVVDALDAILGE